MEANGIEAGGGLVEVEDIQVRRHRAGDPGALEHPPLISDSSASVRSRPTRPLGAGTVDTAGSAEMLSRTGAMKR